MYQESIVLRRTQGQWKDTHALLDTACKQRRCRMSNFLGRTLPFPNHQGTGKQTQRDTACKQFGSQENTSQIHMLQ
jgi:hypothetical protein